MTEGTQVRLDAVVIGAGFSGMYALYHLRERLGLEVQVFESSSDVGGTWFLNRYPGARCDTEAFIYCYSFSKELLNEWTWSGKYPEQRELLSYLQHVADRFDLRRDIAFNTRVVSAHYDDDSALWTVRTDTGDEYVCQYLVSAMGTLASAPYRPSIPGIEDFAGRWCHTGAWPQDLDLTGRRVAVIGTGSTGVQTIPVIAGQADHLYVVQRSPQYTVPAQHHTVDAAVFAEVRARYDEIWEQSRWSLGGFPWQHNGLSVFDVSHEERDATFRRLWEEGGFRFIYGSYKDLMTSLDANEVVAEFVRARMRERIEDPVLAKKLIPYDHPFGSRRPIVDSNYLETFNRDDVTLVDLREEELLRITTRGLLTEAREYQVDVIVFATGFDAVTGPFRRIDVTGKNGVTLQEHWADGASSYLGLMVSDFPNMFTIAGPGSTFGNHPVTMEHHVEWIGDCIAFMRRSGIDSMDPTADAESEYAEEVRAQIRSTVVGETDSWWSGANIPGKPKVPLFSLYSYRKYRSTCDKAALGGYERFNRNHSRAGDSVTADR
ncbi:flavin-containing monooxygenase [Rhodococcus erythropolis]